jgi:hypothetical protein
VAGKTRTFTPKAPRGAPGSDEAILYSGNILYDPGFELFVQNAAPTFLKPGWEEWTGATTYVLPRFDLTSSTGQRWPNGDEVHIKDIAQWSQFTEPYEINENTREMSAWQVVRRERTVPPAPDNPLDFSTIQGPKLGVFMARWYDWTSSENFPFGNGIPGGLLIQGPGMPPGYSGRTEPGALITWALHTWLTEGTGTMDLCLIFYTQDGAPIFTTQSAIAITTTKTEYSITSNSPGGSYFMRACATFRGAGTKGQILAVDTALLAVE